MHKLSNRDPLDRRLFLKTGAATAAGLALTSCADENPDRNVRDKDNGYHVVIVGAGFAGATAARELAAKGWRVIVLEARPRVGGRVFTSQFLGRQIELGGSSVHWVQPHVFAEMQRYGFGFAEVPLYDLDASYIMLGDGTVKNIAPSTFDEKYTSAFNKFCADSRSLFPKPYDPFFNETLHKLESISAEEHLLSLDLDELQIASLRAELTLYAGAPISEFSYTSFVKLFALASWDTFTFTDSEKHWHIDSGGTSALVQAILDDSRATVRLGAVVQEVTDHGDSVSIKLSDGEMVAASTAIFTLPTKVYPDINFKSGLSKEKQAFIDNAEMSDGANIYMRTTNNLGNTFCFCDDPNPFNAVQTEEFSDETGTILKATLGRQSLIDLNSFDAVAAELRKIHPNAELTDIAPYNWVADPYSKQAWPSYRVGWFSKYKDMAKPEGQLFFAGAATADGWHEYIDGAVESGIRAAREAHLRMEQSYAS